MRRSGRRCRGNRLFLNLLNTDSSPITPRCLMMPTGSFSPISPLPNAGPRLEKEKYATRRLSTRHSDTDEMGRLRKTTVPSESALHGWPKEDSGPRTHRHTWPGPGGSLRASLPPSSPSLTRPVPGRLSLSPGLPFPLGLWVSGSLAPSASLSPSPLVSQSLSVSPCVFLRLPRSLSLRVSLPPPSLYLCRSGSFCLGVTRAVSRAFFLRSGSHRPLAGAPPARLSPGNAARRLEGKG